MPKIEVDAQAFMSYLGTTVGMEELERLLPAAKAELDGVDEEKNILKIELNDTNRPDLWSATGLARQLRLYGGGEQPGYTALPIHCFYFAIFYQQVCCFPTKNH